MSVSGEVKDVLVNCYYFLIFCVVVGIVIWCIVMLCIDIFDGLILDLGYILKVFNCGVNVYVECLLLLWVLISVVILE